MDGRAYLLRHEAAFDAIVLDAYADRTALPAHLLTREFFALARSRLAEDGTLYVNLIVAPEPDRLSTRADRTLRSVFAACRTQELGEASRMAQSRIRVPTACARRRRHGVLGRERARGGGRRAGEAVTGAGAGVAPVGRVERSRMRE